ncbi:MAG: DegT/DnrJ/EryC1/StrS family aminotransferase [Acidobacteria bacterium]|nr:DegT/DnrJ/EryC1/StrS family aminotransferase [Acidobacteriota bacterium]MBI3662970.1 DegT/DnrJ/EryC1/StrS family aminotransferase [Acidobacteriota bacterium]
MTANDNLESRSQLVEETQIETCQARPITLGVVDIGHRERQYVNDALNRNRLSAGKYVGAFERRFAQEHGCRQAVACNSGTSALQVALAALKESRGWKDGDEVLVPALTFIATSNIVLYNGMVPKFVDVNPCTYNIDESLIESQITPRTRAIIPVHLFGLPCEMDPIGEIAARHGLEVIEDSCETMFAKYKGRSVGAFGALGCFSTYIAHLLVTGVGGLITTDDEELALLCRSLIAHGRDPIYLSIDDDKDVSDNQLREIISRRFSFVHLGFSYRITELEGALGLAQLERREEIIGQRCRNAKALSAYLRPFEEYLQLPSYPPYSDHSFMMYPIVAREPVEREELINFLEQHQIETRYMFPLLSQPVYRRLFGDIEKNFPEAQRLSRRGFYIGCHHRLTVEDMAHVADVFADYFRNRAGRVRGER